MTNRRAGFNVATKRELKPPFRANLRSPFPVCREAGVRRRLEAVATFIAFTIVALIAGPSLTHFLTRYARAIAAGVLAVLVFGSLLFVPFTEEYARESVPREYWNSPKFKAINRHITVIWGCVSVVMACSHIVAGAIDERRTNIIFNWLIPIALIVYAIKQSSPPEDEPVTAQDA